MITSFIPMLPDSSIEWKTENVSGGTLIASEIGREIFRATIEEPLAQHGAGSVTKYFDRVIKSGSFGCVGVIQGTAIKVGHSQMAGATIEEASLLQARLDTALHVGTRDIEGWTAPEPYFSWAHRDTAQIVSGMQLFDIADGRNAERSVLPENGVMQSVFDKALTRAGITDPREVYKPDFAPRNVLVSGDLCVLIDGRPLKALAGRYK